MVVLISVGIVAGGESLVYLVWNVSKTFVESLILESSYMQFRTESCLLCPSMWLNI